MSGLDAFIDSWTEDAPRPPGADLAPLLGWLAEQPEPVALELACAEHPDPTAGPAGMTLVRLDGCAAGLPAAAYLELAAAGAGFIAVRLDGCAHAAEAADTADAAAAAIREANELLAACGRSERVRGVQSAPAGAPRPMYAPRGLPVSRRRLLRGKAPVRPIPDAAADERTRTLAALRLLLPGDEIPAALAELPAPSAALAAAGCTGNGLCARACPTAALSLEVAAPDTPAQDGAPESFTLTFFPAACTDCGLCIELCPEQALSSGGRHTWAELLAGEARLLAEGGLRRCARCGAPLGAGSEGDLCAVCAFRRKNPFGSRMPPQRA